MLENNFAICRDYLTWLKDTRGRTESTVYNYRSVLTPFLRKIGDTPLGEVTIEEIEAFIRRPRRGRAKGEVGAPATQSKDAVIIRTLYDYLLARGIIDSSPAALLGAPKVHNQNPRPIPDEEWGKLWTACQSDAERFMLGGGFFLGLRRREMCELRPINVFTPNRTLIEFKRKGGGDDVLPYADLCELASGLRLAGATQFPEVLERYADARAKHEHILEWGEQVPVPEREMVVHGLKWPATNPNLVNNRLTILCKRAGTKHYTPHQLRHSAVTNWVRRRVPLHLASRMANHSSPTITMRYIKAGASELREWMDLGE